MGVVECRFDTELSHFLHLQECVKINAVECILLIDREIREVRAAEGEHALYVSRYVFSIAYACIRLKSPKRSHKRHQMLF